MNLKKEKDQENVCVLCVRSFGQLSGLYGMMIAYVDERKLCNIVQYIVGSSIRLGENRRHERIPELCTI